MLLIRWGLLVEINIYLFDAVACFRPSKPLIPTANENMKKAMQSQIVEGMDNKIRNSLVGHLDGQTSLVELLWSEASLSADAVLSYAANNGISVIHHCYY